VQQQAQTCSSAKPITSKKKYGTTLTITLREHLGDISSKRIILTHMSDDILKHAGDVGHEMAHDGMIVTLS